MPTTLLRLFVLTFALAGCGARPDVATTGLHATCPTEGCVTGQTCVEAAGAGGTTRTCEIRCESDGECPEGFSCNLPPTLPDSLVNTCVK